MEMRVFWLGDVAYTIPPWVRHLNTGICRFCFCTDYHSMMGLDPFCRNCEQQGLVFGWHQLK
eukprot:1055578-Heterocapsa_arctica.AAC.1